MSLGLIDDASLQDDEQINSSLMIAIDVHPSYSCSIRWQSWQEVGPAF
jgi:hypothetical protein